MIQHGVLGTKYNKEQKCRYVKICHGSEKKKIRLDEVGETHVLYAELESH